MAPFSPRHRARLVPEEFLCPISKKFMREPVIVPSNQKTYDRKSLESLIFPSTQQTYDRKSVESCNILPLEDEDEYNFLIPNHHLRSRTCAWLRKYDRRDPFAYISTHSDLVAAVTSLLTLQKDDMLEESTHLMDYPRQFNLAIHANSWLANSTEGFLLLCRLIAECPVAATHSHAALLKWMQYAVANLAHAYRIRGERVHEHNTNDLNRMFELIGRVCGDIHNVAFQIGLVNLINPFMASARDLIVNNEGIVRVLASYVLSPGQKGFSENKVHFNNLFNVIRTLCAGAEPALMREPRFAQAMVSFMWPMPKLIDESQYTAVFGTLFTTLKRQTDDPSLPDPVEVMARAGLVSRIFHVLDYATSPEEEQLQNLDGWRRRDIITGTAFELFVVMRCFEMLLQLSSRSVGRLEIVRVIVRSDYHYVGAFLAALARYVHHKNTLVVPALSMIVNLIEYSRFSSIFQRAEGPGFEIFLNLVNDPHPTVREIARRLLTSLFNIQTEERDPPPQEY